MGGLPTSAVLKMIKRLPENPASALILLSLQGPGSPDAAVDKGGRDA
jgi:hypothetical protein